MDHIGDLKEVESILNGNVIATSELNDGLHIAIENGKNESPNL